ncbi:hypothetical protein N7540_011417 [Penicillium herquei]|nr:hypothetical protein N7540_011417 [Penicillium herquei]
MENHAPESHLLFPFNLVSQIWQRIWYGLLCFRQPDCPSSPTSSPRPTRFPLTPTPCSSSDKSDNTRNSSPIFREVLYNEVSSLLGVDFLRGVANKDGVSQNAKRHSLHVSNPDIYAHTSRPESSPNSTHANLSRNSSPPNIPTLPFTINPNPPSTATIGLDDEEMLSSFHSDIIVENGTDEESSFSATGEVILWDYLERCRLRPLPLFARNPLAGRDGLTRALEFFMPSSTPTSNATDESEMEKSTDNTEMHRFSTPDAIPPAPQSRRTYTSRRRPSGIIHAVGSMFKRRFSQVDDESAIQHTPSPSYQPSALSPSTPSLSTPSPLTLSPSHSPNISPSSRSTEWSTPPSRWSRAIETSSHRSPSSGWSFMPQYPGRRSPIYGSEQDYLDISLAAGLAAQEHRATKEDERF